MSELMDGPGYLGSPEAGIRWAIPHLLARSPRPGFPTHDVPREHVDDWITSALGLGIRSVICLLHDSQLIWYAGVPGGLLHQYSRAGLHVVHIPIRDHKTPPIEPHLLPRIWDAYGRLPKPVLVHCSAGVDRTGQAVAYIVRQVSSEIR